LPLSEDEQRRVDAFIQLSRLERGLREFIEVELSRVEGPEWARTVPQDVKEKVQAGGLEATDFPDLRKVLGSAWRKLGDAVSGLEKRQVLVHLEGLEPIRNDIAHSRNVSPGGLAMVQAAYYVLGPILDLHSAAGELPRTPYPRLTLDRVRGALTHSAGVDPSDLESLGDIAGHREMRRAVGDYERVRNRPGKSQALLNEARSTALETVDVLSETIGDE
jgi:Swt1-like HEPN